MKLSDSPVSPCKLAVERETLDPTITMIDSVPHNGMTLRQYYAGLAMQGILSNATIIDRHGLTAAETAHNALDFADSLIRALEKTND